MLLNMMMENIILIFTYVVDIVFTQKCRYNVDPMGYVGCFVDSEDRLLPNAMIVSSSTDNNRCILHCRDAGYMYAGTEIGSQCFCGNNPWRYTAKDVDFFYILNYDCTVDCNADPTQICGGFWRLSVYHTGLNDVLSDGINKYFAEIADGWKLGVGKQVINVWPNIRSSIYCATLCFKNTTCTGFVYNDGTRSCALYNLAYQDMCDFIVEEAGNQILKLV